MTPPEFAAARQTLGLSQNALAVILGVHLRTVQRYEADGIETARPPHATACRVMQWMLAGYRPPEWPKPPQAVPAGRSPVAGNINMAGID